MSKSTRESARPSVRLAELGEAKLESTAAGYRLTGRRGAIDLGGLLTYGARWYDFWANVIFWRNPVRKLPKFTLVAVLTVGLAATAAIAALLEFEQVSAAACAIVLGMLAVMLYLVDRRRAAQAGRERREIARAMEPLEQQVRRVEAQVDMMQRRVIAALETSRLEEADRAREANKAK